jgi:hypothetical protein
MQMLFGRTVVELGRTYALEDGNHTGLDVVEHQRLISPDKVVNQRLDTLRKVNITVVN